MHQLSDIAKCLFVVGSGVAETLSAEILSLVGLIQSIRWPKCY